MGVIPAYGSSEWLCLHPDDARRVAAVCIAAEAHALGGDDDVLRQRLLDELGALRWLENQAEATYFAEIAASVRRMADRPTFNEIEQRIERRWAS